MDKIEGSGEKEEASGNVDDDELDDYMKKLEEGN